MTASNVAPIVRALEAEREMDAFFELAAATFPGYLQTHATPAPGGRVAAGWRAFVTGMPTYAPGQVRGAVEGGQLLGGYLHEERHLNVGGVPLRTGYVGAVVTSPAHRGRGIGTALLRDAATHARARGQSLIVLRGIPDYYGRFGYADVMEIVEHAVEPAALAAHPESAGLVRPATPDDAPALLDLHARHYFPITGSYARTIEQQRHFLAHRAAPTILACDSAGRPRGYLLPAAGPELASAIEAAADDWPAALALLRDQAAWAPGAPELRWPLPPGSPTYHHLADHLPLRTESRSRPDAGLMACLVDARGLLDGLWPIWRERWRRARAVPPGPIVLEVAGERCCLDLVDGDVRQFETAPPGAPVVRLTPRQIVQLVFGSRPVGHLIVDPPAALEVLFPVGIAWYPASNRC